MTWWVTREFMQEHNPYVEKSLMEIGKEKGFTIKVEHLAQDQATDARWSAAIESKRLPDVSKLDVGPVADYQGLGLLVDISDLYKTIGTEGDGWLEAADSFATLSGKQWTIPTGFYPWFTHYRKDKFDKAGVKVPFNNLDEMLEGAKKVNDPKNGFYAFGVQMDEPDTQGNLTPLLWAFGGAWQDKDNNLKILTPQNIAAWKYFTDLYKLGLTPKDSTSWDSGGNNRAYLSGQAAMVWNTGSILDNMRLNRKDKPELGDIFDNTIIGPVPPGPGSGGKPVESSGGLSYSIFSTSKMIDESKDVMKTMFTGKYQEGYHISAGGQFWPTRKKFLKMEFFRKDKLMASLADDIMPLVRLEFSPGTSNRAVGELLNGKNRNLGKAIHRVVVDNWTVEQALEELQKKADEITTKYKK